MVIKSGEQVFPIGRIFLKRRSITWNHSRELVKTWSNLMMRHTNQSWCVQTPRFSHVLCMLDYYIPHCMWFEMPYNLPAGREDLALYNNNEDNLFMWEIQHTNIYKHSGTNRPSRCIREIRGFLLLHNNLYKQKGRCGLWPKCRRVHPKFPTYVF